METAVQISCEYLGRNVPVGSVLRITVSNRMVLFYRVRRAVVSITQELVAVIKKLLQHSQPVDRLEFIDVKSFAVGRADPGSQIKFEDSINIRRDE